jgi:hypothetical protein
MHQSARFKHWHESAPRSESMKQRHRRIYRSAILDNLVRLAYPATTFVYVLLISTLAFHFYKLFRTGSWPKVTLQSMLKISHRAVFGLPDGKGAEKVLMGTVNFLMNASIIYLLLVLIALLVLFLKLTEVFAFKADKKV